MHLEKNVFIVEDFRKLSDFIVNDNSSLIIMSKNMVERGVDKKIFLGKKIKADIFESFLGYPTVQKIDESLHQLRNKIFSYRQIIAIGGGSIIDLAKIFSASILTKNIKMLEICSELKTNNCKNLPEIIAIPTTVGSGAEVTNFATIWDLNLKKKLSIENKQLRPKFIFMIPQLLLTLPSKMITITALDARSHAIESIWSKKKNNASLSFANDSLKLSKDLLTSLDRKNSLTVNELAKLQIASYLSGKAISITKTNISHSLSYFLTMHHSVPHGLAAALTLPAVWKWIVENYKIERLLFSEIQSSLVEIERLEIVRDAKTKLLGININDWVDASFDAYRIDNFKYDLNREELIALLTSMFINF